MSSQVEAPLIPPSWLFRSWDNEAVLFHIASGDTHYLKPLTLALYQTCLKHPTYTIPELAVVLTADSGQPDTQQLPQQIEEMLTGLRDIGLLQS